MIQLYINYLTLTLIILPLLIAGLIRIGLYFININNRFTTVISIVYSSIIFIISLCFLWNIFVNKVEHLNNIWFIWYEIGNLQFHFGCLLDKLSTVILVLITSLSLIIQLYSSVFMEQDNNYSKYFAYIAFFNFSMIFLVIADNFLQLFFGWEAVGLSSYLLINFWFKREAANLAAFKAFLINRLGDLGLLLAIAIIFICFKSLNYNEVFVNLSNNLKNINLIIGLLVLAALTKSAQFPLHVWLPDAMEGPLPISAFMHSATMITAGVFLLLRISPILQFSDYWLNMVLSIGAISAILASLSALIEKDFKRIMAYSTISQLGLMFVSIGNSSYVAGVFHLITHAVFKSLLFLSIGSIYYAINNQSDYKPDQVFNLSLNLKQHLPISYYCLLIGGLSLIGFPGFAGFFSKSLIFNMLESSKLPFASIAYYLISITNIITSIYIFRLFFIVFYQTNSHHKLTFLNNENLNYSYSSRYNQFTINGCIIFLAVISCVIGVCLIYPILNHLMGFNKISQTLNLLLKWSINKAELCTLSGMILAFGLYIYKPDFLNWFKIQIKNNFLFFYNLLEQQYFLNKLNNWILQKTIDCAKALTRFIEELFFNNIINNGANQIAIYISRCIQYIHNNNLNNYMFLMLSGSITILLWLILTTF